MTLQEETYCVDTEHQQGHIPTHTTCVRIVDWSDVLEAVQKLKVKLNPNNTPIHDNTDEYYNWIKKIIDDEFGKTE